MALKDAATANGMRSRAMLSKESHCEFSCVRLCNARRRLQLLTMLGYRHGRTST